MFFCFFLQWIHQAIHYSSMYLQILNVFFILLWRKVLFLFQEFLRFGSWFKCWFKWLGCWICHWYCWWCWCSRICTTTTSFCWNDSNPHLCWSSWSLWLNCCFDIAHKVINSLSLHSIICISLQNFDNFTHVSLPVIN